MTRIKKELRNAAEGVGTAATEVDRIQNISLAAIAQPLNQIITDIKQINQDMIQIRQDMACWYVDPSHSFEGRAENSGMNKTGILTIMHVSLIHVQLVVVSPYSRS